MFFILSATHRFIAMSLPVNQFLHIPRIYSVISLFIPPAPQAPVFHHPGCFPWFSFPCAAAISVFVQASCHIYCKMFTEYFPRHDEHSPQGLYTTTSSASLSSTSRHRLASFHCTLCQKNTSISFCPSFCFLLTFSFQFTCQPSGISVFVSPSPGYLMLTLSQCILRCFTLDLRSADAHIQVVKIIVISLALINKKKTQTQTH